MKNLLKLKFDWRKINKINDFDLLAEILFPNNKLHRKIFLCIIIEMKWYPENIVEDLEFIREKYDFSIRSFQRCRAKVRNAGIIEFVSRFSSKNGFNSGWCLSSRFINSLSKLSGTYNNLLNNIEFSQKEKDFFIIDLN